MKFRSKLIEDRFDQSLYSGFVREFVDAYAARDDAKAAFMSAVSVVGRDWAVHNGDTPMKLARWALGPSVLMALEKADVPKDVVAKEMAVLRPMLDRLATRGWNGKDHRWA